MIVFICCPLCVHGRRCVRSTLLSITVGGQGRESPTVTPRALPAASKHGASSEI